MSSPQQVDLLMKTFYTGRRERLTEAEKQTMADIPLRSESTHVRREFREYIVIERGSQRQRSRQWQT